MEEQNKTSYYNNVVINLSLLDKYLHPSKDFEAIEDNFINVVNIEKYIQIFYGYPIKFENMFQLIKEILSEKYVDNIELSNRNIITIGSRNYMYYYKNNKWKKDSCYDYFSKECIVKIIKQMESAITEKLYIIHKILNNDIRYISEYDFKMQDIELNDIVAIKKDNISNKDFNNNIHNNALDKKWDMYQEILSVLKCSNMVKRVLGLMKQKLNIDNDFREMLDTLHNKKY